DVRKADALDPLERQHVAGGALPLHPRDAETDVAGSELGHLGERGRLKAQIHLDGDRTRQRFHRYHRLQAARLRIDPLDEPGARPERLEVAAKAVADTGAENLDGNRARAALRTGDRGAMDLSDRCGGDRRREGVEQILDGPAEGARDDTARFFLAERRYLVT